MGSITMNIYKIFFDKGLEWRELDYFLHKRMSDLVAIRNHLIVDSYIAEYEKNYVLPDMINSNPPYEIVDPSPDYVYSCQLEETITVLQVMDYKSCCFMRYLNRLKEDIAIAPAINKRIREYINRNPRATYDEIIKIDINLDIATELEHMIEVKEIVSEPIDKKTKSIKETFVLAAYPRQKWILMT